MANKAPSRQVKQLENEVSRILRTVDIYKLAERPAKGVAALKQSLNDAKIYSQSYDYSETREEQLVNSKKATKYLDQALAHILKLSEYDLFGPADVAQLTAQIDQIKADMK